LLARQADIVVPGRTLVGSVRKASRFVCPIRANNLEAATATTIKVNGVARTVDVDADQGSCRLPDGSP
jgi:hypothetical protein